MKFFSILVGVLLITIMLIGCGGSNNSGINNKTLEVGDYFKYGDYICEVTNDITEFNYNGSKLDAKTISIVGSSETFGFFEGNPLTNKDDGSRWIIYANGSYDLVFPSSDAKIGDTWSVSGELVTLPKATVREINGKTYKVYIIKGGSIYYEYCPTIGFFTYLYGKDIVSFGHNTDTKSRSKEVKYINKDEIKEIFKK